MAVQRIVKGTAETKYVSETLLGNGSSSNLGTWTDFSTAITSVGEIYYCLPRTQQGTDECNRIGNTLSPTSCKVKLDITTEPSTNDSFDYTIHVFFLTCPQVKSLANYTAIPILTMMAKGDGTNVPFDGTQIVAQYPINPAEFKVIKHRKYRLMKGFGQAVSPAALDAVNSQTSQYIHLEQRIPLPKKLKYEANNSVYPTNAAPFMVIGWTRNNADPGAVSNKFIKVLGQVQMSYKDS